MLPCKEPTPGGISNEILTVDCSEVDTSTNSTNTSSKEIKNPENSKEIEIPEIKDVSNAYETNDNVTTYNPHKVESWCRICQEAKSDVLISPCKCRGTLGLIHISCLEHWLQVSGLGACEVCFTPYMIHSVPKHSPFVSICIWLWKGGNRKFMVCDIILISLLTLMMYWMIRNSWMIRESDTDDEYSPVISFLSTSLYAIIYLLIIYSTMKFYFKKWLHWHNTRNSVRRLILHDFGAIRHI